MSELRLSEVWIYPIKSLGGIRLQQANIMEKGIELDRRWMIVDENGAFMTQRTLPALALFKLRMENGELKIVHSPQSTVRSPQSTVRSPQSTVRSPQSTVPLHPNIVERNESVTIWNDSVIGFEVNKDTSAWFSEILGVNCRLVHFPEDNKRPVDRNFSVHDEHVSLADAYPFLIIGQRSLDLLNSKLTEPLPMNRFRPNFVFTGGEPNEEDTWKNFTIGNNRFVGVKPCSRCVLTTVNQDTAEKGVEPLRTLATYRKKENKILFGQNLVSIDHQQVNEADVITIQTRV